MNYSLSLNTPLRSIFWSKENSFIKQILLVITGVVLLGISAHISIPLQPVPLTFQSATVILIGMAFGARLGIYTLTAYLLAGACGLPVFAEIPGANLLFLGPTSGYLIGFLPAAALSGYLAQKGFAKNIVGSFVASCLGTIIIFLCGVTGLSFFVGWHKAIVFGLVPFIGTEVIKLLAVSLIIPRFWKNIHK